MALRGISLDIRRGSFVGLMGRSGSGKTTLLNMIGGLDQPTTGEISVYGERLSSMSQERLTLMRRKNIGFIFQSFALLPIFRPGRMSSCRCASQACDQAASAASAPRPRWRGWAGSAGPPTDRPR